MALEKRSTGAADTHGLRVALTRAQEDNALWSRQLEQRGLVPVQLPCLTIEVLESAAGALQTAIERHDGLLFTSTRAVAATCELAPEADLSSKTIGCVGEATARAASEFGFPVQLISPEGTAHSLAREWIRTQPTEGSTLWPCAAQAGPELPQVFEAASRQLESLAVYRTSAKDSINVALAAQADALFFASPSAVAALFSAGLPATTAKFISIGPSTTQALQARGLPVHAEATRRDLDGLLQALGRAQQSKTFSL